MNGASFYYVFILTDPTKTGIKFSGDFARGIRGQENCTITNDGTNYTVKVIDKNATFKIGSDLASSQTATISNISVY